MFWKDMSWYFYWMKAYFLKDDFTVVGSSFQMFGAATEKARLP